MKNYEFTVIFNTSEEMTSRGIELVKSQFEASKVEVAKTDDLGIRNLAYPIKKQTKGHYYYYELSAEADVVNKVSKEFLLDASILKFLFIAK